VLADSQWLDARRSRHRHRPYQRTCSVAPFHSPTFRCRSEGSCYVRRIGGVLELLATAGSL